MKSIALLKYILLAAGLLVCGCGGGKKSSAVSGEDTLELLPEPFNIAFDVKELSSEGAPLMSDVVDSLEYIELASKHLLGKIPTMPYIDDDYIIIYDDELLQYTRKGEYLGKTEITEPDGTQMKEGDQSWLFPLYGNVMVWTRIGVFDMGKLPPHYAISAIDLPSAHIVHREVSKMYPTSGSSAVGSSIIWYDDRGRMNFKEEIDNTAYVINPDFTMTPKAIFDLPKGSNVYFFVETDRYILMKMTYSGNIYAVSFDKSSGESHLVSTISSKDWNNPFFDLTNDVDGGFALPAASSLDAYKMIEQLTPEHLAKVSSTVKYPDRFEKLQKFVASLSEEDNPVIVIAHLK